jgi:hypothetical protein
MPFEEQREQGADLSDIGGNFANLAIALAAMPLALMTGGLGIANHVIAVATGDTPGCKPGHVEYTCDGGIVRHHYRTCCVPPCYGCGGCCT